MQQVRNDKAKEQDKLRFFKEVNKRILANKKESRVVTLIYKIIFFCVVQMFYSNYLIWGYYLIYSYYTWLYVLIFL